MCGYCKPSSDGVAMATVMVLYCRLVARLKHITEQYETREEVSADVGVRDRASARARALELRR